MDDYLEKLKAQFKKDPLVSYGVLGVVAVICCVFVFAQSDLTQKKDIPILKEQSKDAMGIAVGDTEKLEFMKGLQKSYYDFEDRIKAMEEQVQSIKQATEQSNKDQKIVVDSLNNIREIIAANTSNQDTSITTSFELAVAPIKELDSAKEFVYLPIGSFCKGTLLTGVYASSDLNSPLPVLIKLDEAFYGPNKTRVPLKGAFVLGKAVGDINSERALIQIVAISFVLPNGQVFEHEQDIGYVTDAYGELGIKGQVVRNTGKALAVTFLGGFMSGGSTALADNEITTSQSRFGEVERNVTGDVSRHALFSGLAKSSSDLSQYYEKQAEYIIPAVHIPSGNSVYFVVQKGVRINGLLRTNFNKLSSIN